MHKTDYGLGASAELRLALYLSVVVQKQSFHFAAQSLLQLSTRVTSFG